MKPPDAALVGAVLGKNDGAGDGIRTRDIDLGKVALYQLSYSRTARKYHYRELAELMSIGL